METCVGVGPQIGGDPDGGVFRHREPIPLRTSGSAGVDADGRGCLWTIHSTYRINSRGDGLGGAATILSNAARDRRGQQEKGGECSHGVRRYALWT